VAISPEHKKLLQDHAPILHYHGADPYRASSPATLTNGFLDGKHSNELRRRKTPHLVARAAPTHNVARLTLELLAPKGQKYHAKSEPAGPDDYLAAGGKDLAADWARTHAQLGSVDMAYARVQPGAAGRLWLQYWFFYYDNPFGVQFIGPHQGDWELIQIAHDGAKATRVMYFQHESAEKRGWEDVQVVDGKHPVVYVARDSHASYFSAGHHRRLGPLPFIKRDNTAVNPFPVRPTLHFLDEKADRWLLWPGRWGSTFDAIDKSPQGPFHQKTRYAKPEEAWEKAVDVIGAGLAAEAEEEPPLPSTPVLTLAPDGGDVVVTYAFPPRAPEGDVDPVWIRVAVHGATGLPSVGTFDVQSLSETVRQPLPAGGGPYYAFVGVYDEHENERLLGPLGIPSAVAPEPAGAGLAEAEPIPAPIPKPPPLRPGGSEPLRLVVQAPHGGAEAWADLSRALAGEPWLVEPLFGPLDPVAEPELSRFFTLTRPPVPAPGLDAPAAAFQAARELDLGPGWTVEADVPTSALVPDPAGDEADAVGLADELGFDWALQAIHAPQAWALAPRPGGRAMGEGIAIGQPDTGYTNHYELQLALDLLRDRDVLDGDDDAHAVLRGFPPLRFPSHGTSTASVAVSRTQHEVTGSAPLAQVVPIRAARSVILIRNAELAVAVNHARVVGCRVISMSLGGIALPTALRVALQRAVSDGIIVMAAAGQPLPVVVQPASFAECLAVGGTVHGDKPWSLTGRGPEVDWCAPAKNVWVAETDNDGTLRVAPHSGTSFSVALSAGVAALWLAHHGPRAIADAFAPADVQGAFRSLVRATAITPPNWDTDEFGAGIIDAEALLGATLDDVQPTHSQGSPDPLERIAALAQVPEGEVVGMLAPLFPGGAASVAAHADELAYRLAEHPDVRAEVLGTGAEAGLAEDEAPLTRLGAVASPALRAALTR
jgi:Subtilase family